MQSESSASAASPDTPRILLYNAATDSFERRGGERGNNSRQSTSTNPNGFIYGRQSEEQRSAVGCLGTVKSWYTPRYPNENLNVFYSSSDDKKKKIRGIPRYCNGRMKRWQFILLNLTLITLLLLAILVPLFYCVIIPKLIRDKIHSMDINSVNLTYIDLAGFKGQAFGFSAL